MRIPSAKDSVPHDKLADPGWQGFKFRQPVHHQPQDHGNEANPLPFSLDQAVPSRDTCPRVS